MSSQNDTQKAQGQTLKELQQQLAELQAKEAEALVDEDEHESAVAEDAPNASSPPPHISASFVVSSTSSSTAVPKTASSMTMMPYPLATSQTSPSLSNSTTTTTVQQEQHQVSAVKDTPTTATTTTTTKTKQSILDRMGDSWDEFKGAVGKKLVASGLEMATPVSKSTSTLSPTTSAKSSESSCSSTPVSATDSFFNDASYVPMEKVEKRTCKQAAKEQMQKAKQFFQPRPGLGSLLARGTYGKAAEAVSYGSIFLSLVLTVFNPVLGASALTASLIGTGSWIWQDKIKTTVSTVITTTQETWAAWSFSRKCFTILTSGFVVGTFVVFIKTKLNEQPKMGRLRRLRYDSHTHGESITMREVGQVATSLTALFSLLGMPMTGFKAAIKYFKTSTTLINMVMSAATVVLFIRAVKQDKVDKAINAALKDASETPMTEMFPDTPILKDMKEWAKEHKWALGFILVALIMFTVYYARWKKANALYSVKSEALMSSKCPSLVWYNNAPHFMVPTADGWEYEEVDEKTTRILNYTVVGTPDQIVKLRQALPDWYKAAGNVFVLGPKAGKNEAAYVAVKSKKQNKWMYYDIWTGEQKGLTREELYYAELFFNSQDDAVDFQVDNDIEVDNCSFVSEIDDYKEQQNDLDKMMYGTGKSGIGFEYEAVKKLVAEKKEAAKKAEEAKVVQKAAKAESEGKLILELQKKIEELCARSCNRDCGKQHRTAKQKMPSGQLPECKDKNCAGFKDDKAHPTHFHFDPSKQTCRIQGCKGGPPAGTCVRKHKADQSKAEAGSSYNESADIKGEFSLDNINSMGSLTAKFTGDTVKLGRFFVLNGVGVTAAHVLVEKGLGAPVEITYKFPNGDTGTIQHGWLPHSKLDVAFFPIAKAPKSLTPLPDSMKDMLDSVFIISPSNKISSGAVTKLTDDLFTAMTTTEGGYSGGAVLFGNYVAGVHIQGGGSNGRSANPCVHIRSILPELKEFTQRKNSKGSQSSQSPSGSPPTAKQ